MIAQEFPHNCIKDTRPITRRDIKSISELHLTELAHGSVDELEAEGHKNIGLMKYECSLEATY